MLFFLLNEGCRKQWVECFGLTVQCRLSVLLVISKELKIIQVGTYFMVYYIIVFLGGMLAKWREIKKKIQKFKC